jgi:class 3 adenylate cyclase
MAYWIVRTRRDDDLADAAARAIRAARSALVAVAGIPSPLDGMPLGLRIGLNLGTAYSGDFGSETRSAFTLIGHDINVAARLEQARQGEDGNALGPIRLGERLYAHLGDAQRKLFPACTTVMVKRTVVTLYSDPRCIITDPERR